MKKTLSLFLLALSLHGAAQNVPNPGFETWNDCSLFSEPDPFTSLNYISVAFFNAETTLQSEVSHGGNYAAQIVTNGSDYTGYTAGYLTIGYDLMTGADIPYTMSGKPDSISFWAIANLEDGDAASFILTLISQGAPVGIAEAEITGSSDSYTYYSFPIQYFQDGEPDAMQFLMTNTSFGDFASTSNILVDDIEFIYNAGSGDTFPGGDFEIWNDNSYLCADGWGASNTLTYPVLSVTQGEPHSGNHSMRLENLYSDIFETYLGFALLGNINLESCGNGQYTIEGTDYPTGITGYYQYNAGADWDSAAVYLYYTYYDDKMGECIDVYEMVENLPATEGWTPFYVHVPESYVTDWANGINPPGYLTVGLASTAIPLGNVAINGAEGSVLLVDDLQLQFGEILAVNEKQEDAVKGIYPNPANEEFRIQLGKAKIYSASILDQSGRTVTDLSVNSLNQPISTANLSAGVYVLQVISESGIQNSRLVIQH